MLKGIIRVEGETLADLVSAIEEVTRRVRNEQPDGFWRNETSSYLFGIEGQAESADGGQRRT